MLESFNASSYDDNKKPIDDINYTNSLQSGHEHAK